MSRSVAALSEIRNVGLEFEDKRISTRHKNKGSVSSPNVILLPLVNSDIYLMIAVHNLAVQGETTDGRKFSKAYL